MFVDASALVAMMTAEEDSHELAARLQYHPTRHTSPIGVFETTAAVARILGLSVDRSAEAVARFLQITGIGVRPVPAAAGPVAVEAFARYGKGQGHAAQLNMGDCFAYACARLSGEPMLWKGADFALTDIEPA